MQSILILDLFYSQCVSLLVATYKFENMLEESSESAKNGWIQHKNNNKKKYKKTTHLNKQMLRKHFVSNKPAEFELWMAKNHHFYITSTLTLVYSHNIFALLSHSFYFNFNSTLLSL